MAFFSRKSEDPYNLAYMGDVDAAMHQRGHPWAFTLSLSVVCFFLVFYIWASVTMIDDVIRGNGKVIPASGVRDIQSDKGGTVASVSVQEGDTVQANQVVATIANVQDVTAYQDMENKRVELQLSLVRLRAESEGTPLQFSSELQEKYPAAVSSQMQQYQANLQHFEAEDSQLRAQIEQRRLEVENALQEQKKLEENLAGLLQEEAVVRPMVGVSYSQNRYLDLRERIVTKEGELNSVKQTISRVQSAAQAAEQRLQTRAAERQSENARERNKNRMEMESYEKRAETLKAQAGRAELRSPVDGTVKAIFAKAGSVTQPAGVVMQVLSNDEALEIDAKFSPADRGFLYVSQKGKAKFTSYDFSIYGGLKATVIRISDDTILDKRGDPWYEVRLVTNRKSIRYQGKELPILPGMTVTVDLLTDKRSVLDHILGPIFRAQQNAMTEH